MKDNKKFSESFRERFIMWSENSQKKRAMRREKKMAKWKPEVVANIREELENKIRVEYVDEIEKLSDDLYEARRESRTHINDTIHYKAKFEEYKELYYGMVEKYEQKTEKVGEVQTELKEVKKDLDEVLGAEEVDLDDNKDFQKELKTLTTKCNKPDAKKSELMSSFSAKWNVSLKEVINEEDNSITFTWKMIKVD